MADRYVTQAQALELQRRHVADFDLSPFAHNALVGVRTGDDYYIVPDDDPRVTSPAPDPTGSAE